MAHLHQQQAAGMALLTAQDIENLTEGQRLLDEVYDHYFEHSDRYCKGGEGTVTIMTNTYFDRAGSGPATSLPALQVQVYSPVFASGRRQTFDSTADFLAWTREIHAEEMTKDHSKDPFAEMSDEDWQELGFGDFS